jgi:hypothetical protein
MTIVSAECTSFKKERYLGVHDLSTDVIKMALYVSTADLDADTTVYTTTGEVTDAGYIAGGNVLTGVAVDQSGTTAYVDFADSVWAGVALTAAGALVYNSSKANKAVCVLAFGADKTSNASTGFTVVFPPANATYAVLRTA